MWPVLVEFCSARSEDSGRKTKEEEERIAVNVSEPTNMTGGLIGTNIDYELTERETRSSVETAERTEGSLCTVSTRLITKRARALRPH